MTISVNSSQSSVNLNFGISGLTVLLLQSPGDYLSQILKLFQENPRQYGIATLVVIGIVLFFVLSLWQNSRKQQQSRLIETDRKANVSTPGGFITLISSEDGTIETYELGRQRLQQWSPINKGFRVGLIDIIQIETDSNDQIQVIVSVYDVDNQNRFTYWEKRLLLENQPIDIGIFAQLIHTHTNYRPGALGSDPGFQDPHGKSGPISAKGYFGAS